MSFSSLGLIFARPVSVILDQGVVRPFSILPKRTDFHLFQFQFYALRSKSKVDQCSSFNVYFIFFGVLQGSAASQLFTCCRC